MKATASEIRPTSWTPTAEVPSGSADVLASGVVSGWGAPSPELGLRGKSDAAADGAVGVGAVGVGLRVGNSPDALPPGLSTELAPLTVAIPGRPPAPSCELAGPAPDAGSAAAGDAVGVLVGWGRIARFVAVGLADFGAVDLAVGDVEAEGAVTATVADAVTSWVSSAALTSAARLTELPAAASLGTVSWT